MSYTILVVDDSPLIRRMIKRSIGISNLDVGTIHEAGNGREALQVLANHWVDLVLADINMPEMNGIEMVEQMARDEILGKIPVVIVSTERSETRIDHLKKLGVRGYLTKPFTPEEIRDVMLSLLHGDGDRT